MSRRYSGYDYENDWLRLGASVWFDAPWGDDRLYGEIVRTSSNPAYFHVMVDGERSRSGSARHCASIGGNLQDADYEGRARAL